MQRLRVQATLVALGGHHDAVPSSPSDPRMPAVFSLGEGAARKLGVALGHHGELSVVFDELGGERLPDMLGLVEATCPCCEAEVFVATVQAPALIRVYVEREREDRVAEYDDGALAILSTLALHAPRCPKWPEDERDWRGGCR